MKKRNEEVNTQIITIHIDIFAIFELTTFLTGIFYALILSSFNVNLEYYVINNFNTFGSAIVQCGMCYIFWNMGEIVCNDSTQTFKSEDKEEVPDEQ